jgi:signal transduction histidine kinase/CHASE2 domain-containing sensor protein
MSWSFTPDFLLGSLLARFKPGWPRWVTAAAGFLLAVGYLLGVFAPFDRFLLDTAYSLSSRRATEDLLIVEIDGRSLKALNSWPWPRSYHAALLDRLHGAGAASVVFDIDFSSASTSVGDRAFAKSIAAADGTVLLPSFIQNRGATEDAAADGTLPLDIFRKNARVGLVNMFPDPDGLLRQYYLRQSSDGTSIPSMVAQLAPGHLSAPDIFYIDFGIRPETIARLSYIDVLIGKFDPKLVSGRRVLVGATAAELGDRYLVPRAGVMPGVVVLAMAYETLVQNRAITALQPGWGLLGLGATVWLSFMLMRGGWRRAFGAGVGLAIFILAGRYALQSAFALSADVVCWLVSVAICLVVALIWEAKKLAMMTLLQREASRRQEAFTRSVFLDSSEGILVVNAEGVIEAVNPAAQRMLLSQPDTLVGCSISAVMCGFNFAHISERAALADRQTLSSDLTLPGPDGGDVALAITIIKSRLQIDEDGPIHVPTSAAAMYVVTMRDITAQRATEAAREKAVAELKSATLAKSQFLASISHELRTPLNSIIGFSSLISQENSGATGNLKHAGYAADIHESGQRLLQLVNDIIDLSRIEAGEYEIRPDHLDIRSILSSCVHEVRRTMDCAERSLDLAISPTAPIVQADPRALRKAILNVLSNAVKFSPPNGKIILRASGTAAHQLAIEIVDEGIGMDDGLLARITAPFAQASYGYNRQYDGIGIGLYVVNRLIKLQGGTVEIASKPGKGTTVRLLLPRSELVWKVAQ